MPDRAKAVDSDPIDPDRYEPEPINTPDPEATLIAEGAPAEDRIAGPRLGWVMTALMLTLLLAMLDMTIVSTALPAITSDLHGLGQLSWVVTAYLLTSTTTTPIWGKVSDLYGRKVVLQTAVIIFLAGSLLAGAANSMAWLIVTRGIQGLGGGGIIVLVMAVIADVIPPRERGRYTGMFGAVFAVASIAGPLLGGFFVDTLTWRWIFYINLPIGIAALIVLGIALDVPVRKQRHHIDYLGAVMMVAGVTLLLLVTEWGGSRYEWLSPTIIAMSVTSLTLLALFVWRQLRVPEPIVPMTLFRNPVFRVSSMMAFDVGFAMFGAIVFVPLYLQVVLGATPTQSGLELIPMMAGMLTASITSGRIISRIGRYKIFPIIGTALAAIGMFILSRIQVDSSYWLAATGLLILGLGLGNVIQVLLLAVQNSVKPTEIGVAISGNTFFRSIGATIGTAAFGAILASRLATEITSSLPADVAATFDVSQVTSALSGIAGLPAEIRGIVLEAFTNSLAGVFLFAVPFLVVAFVLSWFLKEIHLSKDVPHRGPVAAE